MSTRIRYSKNDGLLKSVKTFAHATNGARFVVTINPDELTFSVVDTTANLEVTGGTGSNLHLTKINAKKALNSLGIEFQSEERKDKNVN